MNIDQIAMSVGYCTMAIIMIVGIITIVTVIMAYMDDETRRKSFTPPPTPRPVMQ